MTDFSRAHIYRLRYKDKDYYGSSISDPIHRYSQHKSNYKHRDKQRDTCTSVFVFESAEQDGGIVEHEVIEWVECTCKKDLVVRERYYRELYPCVNKQVPGRSRDEWNETNREQVLARKEQYRIANRSIIRERDKEHYANNSTSIIERNQKYRTTLPHVVCECGGQFRKDGLSNHIKTQMHLKHLNETKSN
jgi:predicted GIY-YIG superfamily endonuclease